MANRILLGSGWQFHMGELTETDQARKIASKAGMAGGAANLTRAEGIFLPQPPVFTKIMGRDDGIYDVMGIREHLSGNWIDVDIPHDWMFRQPFQDQTNDIKLTDILETVIDNPGYFKHGVAYYRKVFATPAHAADERVRLEFDGVMHNCDIWINGSYIGAHVSGYTSFAFDITEYLCENNVLLVRTDSHGNEGWWYEGAGIYREVRLVVHNALSLQTGGLWARIDSIENSLARGIFFAELTNASDRDLKAELVCRLVSPTGETVCTLSQSGMVSAFSNERLAIPFEIQNPQRWDLDSPRLYLAKAEVSCGGKVIDVDEVFFGVREVAYTRQGLSLNGKPVEIKGVCIHQDFAGVGTALTEDIMYYKVLRLKQMGANAIRSAHHPMTKAMLAICDREGMLVLNENRYFSVNPESLAGLEQLVRDSRNHPCVYMYCLENEEFITNTQQGKAMLRRIKSIVRHLDPTRLVTMAGMIAKGDPDYVAIADVAGFNYDDGDAATHLKNIPGLRVMATEDSSACSTRGIYEDSRENGWCNCYNHMPYTAESMDAGTIGGAASVGALSSTWKHNTQEMPELGGVFIWTGMDYRGESFPWYWPSVCSQFGAMDLCGFEKDAYWYWHSVWEQKPVVHVLPHWNWPGKEGVAVMVETYSNCEETELLVNGVSQGRRKTLRGDIESWKVLYQPGELTVVGYNSGAAVAGQSRKTFGEVFEIRLEQMLYGKELALIKAAAYDAAGNFCETANIELQFTVTGGTFVGCGNGDPASHEDDTVPQRKLFNGLALAIVKHGDNTVFSVDYAISGGKKRSGLTLRNA